MRTSTIGLLLMLAVALSVSPWVSISHAQVGADRSDGERQVYTYARPGQETITLYVWGAVNQPGIWKVAPKTGLVELFSVIQPRGYGVESPSTDTDVMVRIHRTRDGQTRLVRANAVRETSGSIGGGAAGGSTTLCALLFRRGRQLGPTRRPGCSRS